MKIIFSEANLVVFQENKDSKGAITIKTATARTFAELQKMSYTYRNFTNERMGYFEFVINDPHIYSNSDLQKKLGLILQKWNIAQNNEKEMNPGDAEEFKRILEHWSANNGNKIIEEILDSITKKLFGASNG